MTSPTDREKFDCEHAACKSLGEHHPLCDFVKQTDRAALEQDCGDVEVVAWSDGEINAFISDECKRYGNKLGGATGRATDAHQTALITLASHKAKLAAVEAERDAVVNKIIELVRNYDSCDGFNSQGRAVEIVNDELRKLLASKGD